jgi:hypothetical protein
MNTNEQNLKSSPILRWKAFVDSNNKAALKEIENAQEECIWTTECTVDELSLCLAGTKETITNDKGRSILVRKYYKQARELTKRIPIAKPPPDFIINISDLTSTKLKEEIANLVHHPSCPVPSIDVLVGQTFDNSGNNIHEKTNLADNGEGKKKKKKNERNQDENNGFKPNKHTAYKYSNNGKGPLHEAVILAGLPVFLDTFTGKI